MPTVAALSPERALLVGVSRSRVDRPEVDEHLEELRELARTAGARVVGLLVQERGDVRPATLLRSGKVEEAARLASETEANLVIFDEDLSPAQIRNLEKAIAVRVIDRSALILDIFAQRARSREARTQVELARLRHLLPRLTRQWTHLSRQDGGIGQRGIGETQLEIDRRLIRRRIARLAEDLAAIESERGERRKNRHDEAVALVGYTNAGKSTLLNLLTGAGTLVEDRLFATLDPLVRRCDRGGRPPFLVIDTVGFIRKLPHHLVASFRSTLEEAAETDLLVHVVDTSSPALADHMRTVRETLEDLRLAERPQLVVFNKTDLVPAGVLDRLRDEHPGAVFMSALQPEHADLLEQRVRGALGDPVVEETLAIPAHLAGVVARIDRRVQVLHTAWSNGHLEVRVRARRRDLDGLLPRLHAMEGRA